MTAKDFKAMAAARRRAKPATENYSDSLSHAYAEDAWERTVYEVSEVLATTNPRFDRLRFAEAAGRI